MSRIDGHMMRMYNEGIKRDSHHGKKISSLETLDLINYAERMNHSSSGSSFRASDCRGNRHLKRLLKRHEEHFSLESRQMIKDFIKYHRIPTLSTNVGQPNAGPSNGPLPGYGIIPLPTRPVSTTPLAPSTPAAPTPSTPTPTAPVATPILTPVRPSGGISVTPPATGVTVPTPPEAPPASPARPSIPPASPTHVGSIGAGSGIEGPHGIEIFNWTADKKTGFCHWFPQQETRPGGDSTNNLYAVNGPLDKLDRLMGTQAREFEFNKFRKAVTDGKQYSWWGHCDKASTVACLLDLPKHGVVMTNAAGEKIQFTPNDIQGLLVKVVPYLSTNVDFKGNRFNDPNKDDPNDPYPHVFMETMRQWAQDGLPFVLDIDPGPQVWNFPYDQSKIYESTQPPKGFNPEGLPTDGSVKYYRIEMEGTGFPQKARIYQAWVQNDANGKAIKSGWIKTPESHPNPDFMWRPHPIGDLKDPAMWVARGKIGNPEVDPKTVYEIWMKSLA